MLHHFMSYHVNVMLSICYTMSIARKAVERLCPYLPFAPFGKPLQSHQEQTSQILPQAMQSQRYLELSEKIMLTFLSWDVFFIREKCPLPF